MSVTVTCWALVSVAFLAGIGFAFLIHRAQDHFTTDRFLASMDKEPQAEPPRITLPAPPRAAKRGVKWN